MKIFYSLTLICSIAMSSHVYAGDKHVDRLLLAGDIENTMQEVDKEMQHAIKVLRELSDKDAAERPFIGILLEVDQKGDQHGVGVLGVTPDSPALNAGLRAGDIITGINGSSMAGDTKGGPHSKLYSTMSQLKPGDKLSLDVERDGKPVKVEIVAARRADYLHYGLQLLADDMEKKIGKHAMPHTSTHGALGRVELVRINKGLGEYFGTDTGMLVLRAPPDENLPLNSGDVIVKIGERVPNSPSQTWRILNSYDSGEKIPLKVMRKQKLINLQLTQP